MLLYNKIMNGKDVPKNKKGQPSRLPQSFFNLKSNTMKNTLQSYDFFLK